MGNAGLALLAILASQQDAVSTPTESPPSAVAQQGVTRSPRPATELVAQPVEVKPGEAATAPRDPAGTAVVDPAPADPAPPPADPAPNGGGQAGTPPAPPPEPVATGPAAGAPPASGAATATVTGGPASTVTAAPRPGFSETVAPLPAGGTAAGEAPPLPPSPSETGGEALPWLALVGLLLTGAAALAATMKVRRRRLVERTRAMLALEPSLDTGPGPLRAPGLALAGPSTSIRSRLEPGALRWRE